MSKMGQNVCAICALYQREWACDSHRCDFLFIPVQGDWHLHSGGTACSESHGSVSDSRHKRFWQDMTPARICLWWRAHREGMSRRCFVTEKISALGESVKTVGEIECRRTVSAVSYGLLFCNVISLSQSECQNWATHRKKSGMRKKRQ